MFTLSQHFKEICVGYCPILSSCHQNMVIILSLGWKTICSYVNSSITFLLQHFPLKPLSHKVYHGLNILAIVCIHNFLEQVLNFKLSMPFKMQSSPCRARWKFVGPFTCDWQLCFGILRCGGLWRLKVHIFSYFIIHKFLDKSPSLSKRCWLLPL